jgi:hypothetical protein
LNDVAKTPDTPQFDAANIKRRVRRRRSALTGLALGAVLIGGGTTTALALTGPAASSSPNGAATSGISDDAPKTTWVDPAAVIRDTGSKLLTDTGRHTGAEHFSLPAQPQTGGVWTSIECQGIGKVTVTLGSSLYTEPCSTAVAKTAASNNLNAELLPFSTPATHLEVKGDPGVTWDVAVGWSGITPNH